MCVITYSMHKVSNPFILTSYSALPSYIFLGKSRSLWCWRRIFMKQDENLAISLFTYNICFIVSLWSIAQNLKIQKKQISSVIPTWPWIVIYTNNSRGGIWVLSGVGKKMKHKKKKMSWQEGSVPIHLLRSLN